VTRGWAGRLRSFLRRAPMSDLLDREARAARTGFLVLVVVLVPLAAFVGIFWRMQAGIRPTAERLRLYVTSTGGWSVERFAAENGLMLETTPGGWVVPVDWTLCRADAPYGPSAVLPSVTKTGGEGQVVAQYMILRPRMWLKLEYLFVAVDPSGPTVTALDASDYMKGWLGLIAAGMCSTGAAAVLALACIIFRRSWTRTFREDDDR